MSVAFGMATVDFKKPIKLADLILAGVVLLIATIVLKVQLKAMETNGFHLNASSFVAIEINGERINTIPFDDVKDISIIHIPTKNNNTITLEISESKKVRIIESDCPDKTCVKTGWISLPGQAIVCLPNRTVIKIESHGATSSSLMQDLDAITY